MNTFGGPVLFLDRNDINTDEIIPAKYLTEVTKAALQPYLLEDLKLEGFDRGSPAFKNARVIVTRKNFGCGSSREHAPWALEVNNVTVVIAESYARIFRQNMFNGGLLAIELSPSDIDKLFSLAKDQNVACSVDINKKKLLFSSASGQKVEQGFSLGEFDNALVTSGGWVGFAEKKY